MQRTPERFTSSTSPRGRRRAGVVLAGALLAVAATSGCAKLTGFDVETDLPYIPNHGANYRVASVDAPVDVVGLVIVSAQDGSGTLIGTFANNDPEPATTPEITTGDEDNEITGYTPFELEANGLVNMASDEWIEANDPVVVEGEQVTPGASIAVTVGEGDLARELWVPVVPNAETTTTQPVDHGEESGEGEESEEDHGGLDESHDEAPNPWAGLDRSNEAQPARPTVDPTAGETQG